MILFAKLIILLFLYSRLPFTCTTPTKKTLTSEITQEASTSQIKVEEVDNDLREQAGIEEFLDSLFKHNIFSDENQEKLIKQIEEIKILNPTAMEYLVNYQEFTKMCDFLNKKLTNKYHKNNIFKDSSKGVPDEIKNPHNLYLSTVELKKLSFDSILKARGVCEQPEIRKEYKHYTEIIEYFKKLNIQFKPEFLFDKKTNIKKSKSLKNDHRNFEIIKKYNPAAKQEKAIKNQLKLLEENSTKNFIEHNLEE
ncbi:unnamed protein product [Meloidogyne enterolobii]|uniref:Uncharacterized protein n=1 Tax=Meloidogyne enterolobii TaxID=390850 RepID=A0ACB0ZVP2_MELEN